MEGFLVQAKCMHCPWALAFTLSGLSTKEYQTVCIIIKLEFISKIFTLGSAMITLGFLSISISKGFKTTLHESTAFDSFWESG
jgi:hypothetical protein